MDPPVSAPRRHDYVSCVDVDAATCAELRAISRGRTLLMDYFAVVGRWGVVLGDVELRWVERPDELPRDAVRVDDIDGVPVFMFPELAPLLARVKARLRVAGPRWAPFLRHPALTISDGEAWLDFFAARATPFGRRR